MGRELDVGACCWLAFNGKAIIGKINSSKKCAS